MRELPEGQYYQFQLIGLDVVTTAGDRIGKVTGVEQMPANDIYVVGTTDGEVLVPAIEAVVKAIEPGNGRIVIEPVPGLLELNRREPKKRR